MISAITTGYRKGIATIIDANVITLLTAFILFGLATAGVKGFAFTLGVGTIVSLLTAVVFTRAVLGLLGRSRILRSPSVPRRRRGARPLALRLRRREQVVLLDFGRDPADRGALVRHQAARLRHRLRVRLEARTSPSPRTPAVDEIRESLGAAGVENADAVKIQEVENAEFGENVFQISGQARARPGRSRPGAARPGLRLRGRAPRRGFQSQVGRPDLRRAGRQERRLRDRLLAAADRRLRSLPLRGQVRDPGDDRRRSTTS